MMVLLNAYKFCRYTIEPSYFFRIQSVCYSLYFIRVRKASGRIYFEKVCQGSMCFFIFSDNFASYIYSNCGKQLVETNTY